MNWTTLSLSNTALLNQWLVPCKISDGVFKNVGNLTLARSNSYLEFLKAGIKQATLMSIRTAPIHMSALFPDHINSKAEEEICHHEDKHTSGPSHKKPQCCHPYSQSTRQQQDSDPKPGLPTWKQIRRR